MCLIHSILVSYSASVSSANNLEMVVGKGTLGEDFIVYDEWKDTNWVQEFKVSDIVLSKYSV